MSNFRAVLTVLETLNKRQIFSLIGVFLLMLITAVLETFNIALLLPLIQSAMGPNTTTVSVGLFERLGLGSVFRDISGAIGEIAVFVLSIYFVKSLFIGASLYLQAMFTSQVRAYFTVRLARGLVKRSYEDHINTNSAHAVHDISQTAPSVVGSILMASMGIAMEVLLSTGAVLALFLIDPLSAIVAASFVCTALGLYYASVRKITYRLGAETLFLAKRQSQVSHFFIGATKEAKVLQRENYFVELIGGVARALARVNALTSFINQLPRLYGEFTIIGAIVLVSVIIIHSYGSVDAAFPILGVFAAAAFRVMPSSNRIVHYFVSFRQTVPLLVSIYPDLQSVNSAKADPRKTVPLQQKERVLEKEIELSNVSYAYPEAAKASLLDVSLTVQRGQTIGIVGSTGAGKSTLVDLILGLLKPTEGEITVDGKNVHERNDFWAGRIGYVPQNVYLMDDTFRKNVAIGVPDDLIDEDRIDEAVKISQLSEVVAQLKDGLNTQIGESGIKLSGGQRQRIGIARALYSRPEVIVMDEATSALDSATENELSAAISALAGSRTLILISHRLKTVKKCDRIFVLDRGRLAATGTYHELYENEQLFRALAGD